MPRSWRTAISWHQKKERWETSKSKTNHRQMKPQTKKNCNRGTAFGLSAGKLMGQFFCCNSSLCACDLICGVCFLSLFSVSGGLCFMSLPFPGYLNKFNSREPQPLILMQLQITDICSVRIGIFYLICETSQCNTYIKKYWGNKQNNWLIWSCFSNQIRTRRSIHLWASLFFTVTKFSGIFSHLRKR